MAPPRASSPTSETTTDLSCLSSDNPRGQRSFPRSSPAGRVCRSTPAPRSGVRADVSAFASCRSQCRRRITARPTLLRRRKRYSASSRLLSAKRPSNGCGRTGSGASRSSPLARQNRAPLTAEFSADYLPAALDGQIPQPRAFRAGLLQLARRCDLLAIDGDDDVAFLHADLRRGRIVADLRNHDPLRSV